jgi:hypothetical protein
MASNAEAVMRLMGERFPVLDKGHVQLIDVMGDDHAVCDAARSSPATRNGRPEYLLAIKDALANGYRVDTERGLIIGLKGRPLTIACRGSQVYPSVPLVTPNMPRRFYSVPAHKVIAYAIWGDAAFAVGVEVRHLKSDRCDIRGSNLALGTSSQNQLDKAPEVRRRAAVLARRAQGPVALNRKLTFAEAEEIRRLVAVGGRGTRIQLARRFGVDSSTITRIVDRRIYVEPGA